MNNKAQETANHWNDAYLDDKAIVRWKSNEMIPFEDILHEFTSAGYILPNVATDSELLRQEEQMAFLADYRVSQSNRSAEQIAEERMEARAAMGPGVEMVNVFTGEKYTS